MPLTNEQVTRLNENRCLIEAQDLLRRSLDIAYTQHKFGQNEVRYGAAGTMAAIIGANKFEACMARANTPPNKGR
ncbi:hypothetical protein [Sandarakinorhabdus cyanobacteriorum]|uniref:hypothetical protein n=1 Tax=Sandarakinorhabdus cyanobacteriorum TaxID=1981098 RepID=UPI0013FDA90F|nr:hypothetical protein [Sandarakinorhabdus cyanobacteriorum]